MSGMHEGMLMFSKLLIKSSGTHACMTLAGLAIAWQQGVCIKQPTFIVFIVCNFAQAMAAYRTAARLFPGLHLPLIGMGMEYQRMNNLHLAEQMFWQVTRRYRLCCFQRDAAYLAEDFVSCVSMCAAACGCLADRVDAVESRLLS